MRAFLDFLGWLMGLAMLGVIGIIAIFWFSLAEKAKTWPFGIPEYEIAADDKQIRTVDLPFLSNATGYEMVAKDKYVYFFPKTKEDGAFFVFDPFAETVVNVTEFPESLGRLKQHYNERRPHQYTINDFLMYYENNNGLRTVVKPDSEQVTFTSITKDSFYSQRFVHDKMVDQGCNPDHSSSSEVIRFLYIEAEQYWLGYCSNLRKWFSITREKVFPVKFPFGLSGTAYTFTSVDQGRKVTLQGRGSLVYELNLTTPLKSVETYYNKVHLLTTSGTGFGIGGISVTVKPLSSELYLTQRNTPEKPVYLFTHDEDGGVKQLVEESVSFTTSTELGVGYVLSPDKKLKIVGRIRIENLNK
jgi:hypothetical protein